MPSCCPNNIPPASSVYVPKNVGVYESGDFKAKTAIIYIHDIFGWTLQAKEVADLLAERINTDNSDNNVRIIAPDIFQGKPWPVEKFPEDLNNISQDIYDWILGFDYETVVKPIILKEIEKLRYQGVTTFHAVGFCWGGRIVFNLQQEGYVTKVATAHPSLLSVEKDGQNIKGPICILAGSDDQKDYEELFALILNGPYADSSYAERFNNVRHGYLGARLNRDDPIISKVADHSLDIFAQFFINTGKLSIAK